MVKLIIFTLNIKILNIIVTYTTLTLCVYVCLGVMCWSIGRMVGGLLKFIKYENCSVSCVLK